MSLNPLRIWLGALMCAWTFIAQAESEAHHHTSDTDAQSLMHKAGHILTQAQALELESVDVFRNANDLLNQIKTLRITQRELAGTEQEATFTDMVNTLNTQREHWQAQGAKLRRYSGELKTEALGLMEIGFRQVWADKVHLTGPMRLMPESGQVMAHNAQVRSVHPTMLNQMDDGPDTQKDDGMTMSMPGMSGQQAPEDLDISTFQASRNLSFFAHVEPLTEPHPMVPLNEIHEWRLLISDADGQPVSGADIVIDGHMPGHVHGLPTQPRVTTEVAPGEYLVEGMKFQMTGWWVMQFDVTQGDTQDALVFNIVL